MEWQPIETAPKDRRIMLYRPTTHYAWARIVFGEFNDDRHARKPRPYWNHDRIRLSGVADAREHEPTHWMDAPSPPQADGLGKVKEEGNGKA